MDSRIGSVSEGQAMNEWIRETPMREMAAQLEIPELPMRQPGFKFYEHAVHHLKNMGFVGQELYHAAHEVIQTLFFNIGKRAKTVEGPIYRYVQWYEDQIADGVSDPQPFDEFFKYAFRQKANTQLQKLLKQKKKRGLSIDYRSQGDDEGTVGEEFLGDTEPSAEDVASEQEEREKRSETFKQIPKMLSEHRLGDKYISVWGLMQKNYKLQEIADELNARGVLAPGGGEWGTGSVHKVRNQIYGMVKRFLEQQGIDWESIAASRKGFRFGGFPEG